MTISNYTDIKLHVLRSTEKIWREEAEKHNMTLEEFIAKVLLDYKLKKDS